MGRVAAKPPRYPFRVEFKKLRRERRERELSQKQLAKAAGVYWMTISNLELGKLKNPTIMPVIACARAMGVDWRRLLEIVDLPDEQSA